MFEFVDNKLPINKCIHNSRGTQKQNSVFNLKHNLLEIIKYVNTLTIDFSINSKMILNVSLFSVKIIHHFILMILKVN